MKPQFEDLNRYEKLSDLRELKMFFSPAQSQNIKNVETKLSACNSQTAVIRQYTEYVVVFKTKDIKNV